MPKLKKAVKKKWVEALRSGKYPQARDRLAKPDGYCCLGVLCEVAIESGLAVEVEDDHGYKRYDRAAMTLPDSVAQWAFLKSDRPTFGDVKVKNMAGQKEFLSNINDDGIPFDEIANRIERSL
jgi:hypothetical protein